LQSVSEPNGAEMALAMRNNITTGKGISSKT